MSNLTSRRGPGGIKGTRSGLYQQLVSKERKEPKETWDGLLEDPSPPASPDVDPVVKKAAASKQGALHSFVGEKSSADTVIDNVTSGVSSALSNLNDNIPSSIRDSLPDPASISSIPNLVRDAIPATASIPDIPTIVLDAIPDKVRESLPDLGAVLGGGQFNPTMDAAAPAVSFKKRALHDPAEGRLEQLMATNRWKIKAFVGLLLVVMLLNFVEIFQTGVVSREADTFDRIGVPDPGTKKIKTKTSPKKPAKDVQTSFLESASTERRKKIENLARVEASTPLPPPEDLFSQFTQISSSFFSSPAKKPAAKKPATKKPASKPPAKKAPPPTAPRAPARSLPAAPARSPASSSSARPSGTRARPASRPSAAAAGKVTRPSGSSVRGGTRPSSSRPARPRPAARSGRAPR